MMMKFPTVVRLIALILTAAASSATARAADVVTVTPFFDAKQAVAGKTVTLALRVAIADRFHIQSAKPLDASLVATRVKIKPADGIKAGIARFPADETINAPGLSADGKLAVYAGTVYVLVPLQIDADAAIGPRKVQFLFVSQACDDKSCQPPEKSNLDVTLDIAPAGTAVVADNADVFAKANAQRFMPADDAATQPATRAAVPPHESALVTAVADNDLHLIRQRDYRPAASAGAADSPVWQLSLLALAGGMVLNVMPCVLPVVPLKVLTLVQQAHGRRGAAVLHAVVFAGGIVSLFLLLAVAAGVLRALGVQVMYGQQFQSPVLLTAMGYVVLALALSMLGTWTINTPQAVYGVDTSGGSLAGSFMMGLLATLLATPCSAPLLGPVLAWALVKPVWLTMLFFALVGIGMAVPYVLLAAFPAGLNKLPKAGRWTQILKQFLGLVMAGVALYLLLQLPVTAMPWAMSGALLVALVCWAWGQIPTLSMMLRRVWTIRGAAVAVGLLAGVGLYRIATRPALDDAAWRSFSVAEMDQALKDGRPVLVDFTASWCINCRFVEASVPNAPEVTKPLRDKNALLLKADLTSDNPAAKTLLAKLDSRSIPVLAVFTPKAPLAPAVLRDIYTKQSLLSELAY